MNTTNAAVGTGAIVVLGTWQEQRTINIHVVVGVVFLAFMLSILPQKIAVPVAYLILVGVSFRYLPGLLNGLQGGSSLATPTPPAPASRNPRAAGPQGFAGGGGGGNGGGGSW